MIDDDVLLAPNFLFHFAVQWRRAEWKWGARGATPKLSEAHRIPNLRALEGKRTYAEVRCGWSEQGVLLQVDVRGKTKPLACRRDRLAESDGVQVWLATRDSRNVHRAGRFCHRFVFLPGGGEQDSAYCSAMPIARSRETPAEPPPESLAAVVANRRDGYTLQVQISSEALTGFDPTEHRRLSFQYATIDKELGWQTLSLGPEFPFAEDPSLWVSVELVD